MRTTADAVHAALDLLLVAASNDGDAAAAVSPDLVLGMCNGVSALLGGQGAVFAVGTWHKLCQLLDITTIHVAAYGHCGIGQIQQLNGCGGVVGHSDAVSIISLSCEVGGM